MAREGVILGGAVRDGSDVLTVKVQPQATVTTSAERRTDTPLAEAEEPDKDLQRISLLCMKQAQGRATGQGSLNQQRGWIRPNDEKVLRSPRHGTGLNRASLDNTQTASSTVTEGS